MCVYAGVYVYVCVDVHMHVYYIGRYVYMYMRAAGMLHVIFARSF